MEENVLGRFVVFGVLRHIDSNKKADSEFREILTSDREMRIAYDTTREFSEGTRN